MQRTWHADNPKQHKAGEGLCLAEELESVCIDGPHDIQVVKQLRSTQLLHACLKIQCRCQDARASVMHLEEHLQ